jgi:3-oxoacyl-[acyl-carrier-protein] synthase-3
VSSLPSPSSEHARIPIRLLGTGAYLPERIVDNAEVAGPLGVDRDWIQRRTGLVERRFADAGEATSDLAAAAGARALEAAGCLPDEIDLVICATCSPDHAFPSTAALVAERLALGSSAAFDLQAGCAGFVYAFVTAAQQVALGVARKALVIGADVMSRLVDPADRDTAVLFGDGAGAAVLARSAAGEGIISLDLGSDGGRAALLSLPAGGSRKPASAETLARGEHVVHMQGRALYRIAVRHTVDAARRALAAAGLDANDVDLVVPHQSSRRLITAAAKALGIDLDRFVLNLDRYGNTSSASLPIALDEAVRDGRVAPGKRVLLLGFGAGLSWGATLLRT